MKPLHEQLKEAMSSNTKDLTIKKDLLGIDIIEVVALDKAATACAEIVKEYVINFVKYITLDEWEYSNGRYVRNVFNSNGELILEKISHNEIYALFLKETESNQQEVKQESEEMLWHKAMIIIIDVERELGSSEMEIVEKLNQHFKIENRK